jgi:hypothetical protein
VSEHFARSASSAFFFWNRKKRFKVKKIQKGCGFVICQVTQDFFPERGFGFASFMGGNIYFHLKNGKAIIAGEYCPEFVDSHPAPELKSGDFIIAKIEKGDKSWRALIWGSANELRDAEVVLEHRQGPVFAPKCPPMPHQLTAPQSVRDRRQMCRVA